MVINISEILKVYGGEINVDGDVSLSDINFLGEDFVFETPMHIAGNIVNNGKALELNAVCTGTVQVHCARCMKELNREVSFKIREFFVQSDGENDDDDEDVVFFEGYTIDVADIVVNHFLMNVSGKYLCSEDCRGLCPKCGADLNLGDCGCETDDIDPRWAKLADIMKKSTE